MSFALSTAAKDLRRHLRDPAGFAMWIGAPLLVGLLISLAAGGRGGPSPQAHLLVADLDDSFVSGFLVGAMSQEAAGGFIRAEEVELADGRARVARGKASALLVIPEGFGEALLREEPSTLELVKNPAERILPAMVEETLSIFVDGMFYVHRLLGDELREIATQEPPEGAHTLPDELVASFSVRVNRTMERLSTYLFPPAIELEVETAEEEEESPVESSPAMYFVPGLIFMSLLFMSQGIGQDVWTERNGHTLRRALVTPQRVTTFLAGKVLAGAALMSVVCAVALVAAWVYFELPPANLLLAVVWTVISGVVLLTMLLVVMLHASSERTAGILTMAIIFPLMMLGGSFFPFEAMPAGMAAVGKLTPNGWALQQLKAIVLDEIEPAAMVRSLAGIVGAGTLLFLWSASRLRSGFARG